MRLLVVLLVISVSLCGPINLNLAPLVKIEHQYPPQNFTVKNRQNFKYEFENSGDTVVTITDSKGTNADDSCSFVPYQIDTHILAEFKLQVKDQNRWSSMKTNLAIVQFQSLIYTIENTMVLTAYSFNQSNIVKIASVQLPVQKPDSDSRVHFALTKDQTVLFLFSIHGLWRIQTKGILTRIQKMDNKFEFTVYSAVQIGDWLLVTTMTNGVILFQIGREKIQEIGLITNYQNATIYPIDLKFDQSRGLLFVLDNIRNIYVYKMVERQIYYFDVIEVQHSANFKLALVESRIYYSFIQGNTIQIAELFYNQTAKEAHLVRYFKEFDYVNDFVATREELFVLSHQTLDIYPAYVDPRLISSPHNGIRLQIIAKRLFPISFDIYLVTTAQSLRLIKLQRSRSHIFCNFRKQKESLHIQYKSNVSQCGSQDKVGYNSYCEVIRNINIEIDIPEEIQRQKVLMYALVVLVLVFFLVALICLVQWRNGRLDIIDKLIEEIRRHKHKQKRARQFVDENDVQLPGGVSINQA